MNSPQVVQEQPAPEAEAPEAEAPEAGSPETSAEPVVLAWHADPVLGGLWSTWPDRALLAYLDDPEARSRDREASLRQGNSEPWNELHHRMEETEQFMHAEHGCRLPSAPVDVNDFTC